MTPYFSAVSTKGNFFVTSCLLFLITELLQSRKTEVSCYRHLHLEEQFFPLTLLHSEWPKLYGVPYCTQNGQNSEYHIVLRMAKTLEYPIALRMVKTLSTILPTEWPKLYAVLGILSAIGFRVDPY